jgi:hypothetical protein
VDTFALIVLGGIVLVVVGFLALGRWHPARASDVTDSGRQKDWAAQAEIEEHDVGEMVEGQNVYRRARGDEEITSEDAQRAGNARQRESIDRATDE